MQVFFLFFLIIIWITLRFAFACFIPIVDCRCFHFKSNETCVIIALKYKTAGDLFFDYIFISSTSPSLSSLSVRCLALISFSVHFRGNSYQCMNASHSINWIIKLHSAIIVANSVISEEKRIKSYTSSSPFPITFICVFWKWNHKNFYRLSSNSKPQAIREAHSIRTFDWFMPFVIAVQMLWASNWFHAIAVFFFGFIKLSVSIYQAKIYFVFFCIFFFHELIIFPWKRLIMQLNRTCFFFVYSVLNQQS